MLKEYIKTAEIWKFFENSKDKLRESSAIVADNTETDHSVCIGIGESQYPTIMAFRGDKLQEKELVIDEEDCAKTMRYMVAKYLVTVESKNEIKEQPKTHPVYDDDGVLCGDYTEIEEDEFDLYEQQWEDVVEKYKHFDVTIDEYNKDMDNADAVMYERQDNVMLAAKDFLEILLEDDAGMLYAGALDDVVDDFIHHVMMWFAATQQIPIWYPTLYKNDGEEKFATYPYDDMIDVYTSCEFV